MTRHSATGNILPNLLVAVQIAQDVYRQWAVNGLQGTTVPQQCLDNVLRWREWFEHLDALDDSRSLAAQFDDLAHCRLLVVGQRMGDAEKQAIIPQVQLCLAHFRAEAEGMIG